MEHGFIITTYREQNDPKCMPYLQQNLIDTLTLYSFVKDVHLGVGDVGGKQEPVVICELFDPWEDVQKCLIDKLAERYQQDYWILIAFESAYKRVVTQDYLGLYRPVDQFESFTDSTINFSTGVRYIIR